VTAASHAPEATAGARRGVDPRARLVALVLVQCAAFVAAPPLGAVLLAVGLVVLARTAEGRSARRLAVVLVAGGFLFGALLNALFVRSGEELVRIPPGLALTRDGLDAGLAMGLRMGNLSAFALAFAFATPPSTFAAAVTALLAPLARVFGRRVHTSAFQTEIAVRFVPFLAAEAQRIAIAQRFRGLRPGRSPLARLRAAAPLFVPVFAQAVLRADRLATLLSARGYRPGLPRARTIAGRWGLVDLCTVGSAAAALVAGVALG
jgi:energy-coupling factor transport system permease protein